MLSVLLALVALGVCQDDVAYDQGACDEDAQHGHGYAGDQDQIGDLDGLFGVALEQAEVHWIKGARAVTMEAMKRAKAVRFRALMFMVRASVVRAVSRTIIVPAWQP